MLHSLSPPSAAALASLSASGVLPRLFHAPFVPLLPTVAGLILALQIALLLAQARAVREADNE